MPRSPASTGFHHDLVQIPIDDVAPTPGRARDPGRVAGTLVREARTLAVELLGPDDVRG
ncbi:hypothetical protein LQ327_31540 [Actinomycetospora endophytica]|uniref:Uncharacterized protein n=1 Tax=Actinomycetospora endophytica TaxID=2291215 RepID=A0ABS8PI07_9PSEU|nr:hypothetical protein [Actinomycetospora endophytica]MCD2197913.1 hypothetical protein [Actinomycetospora endophytica]